MYNYKDKESNIQTLNDYMLLRSLSMFDYDWLPTTLPTVEIEKQLQVNGFTFITKVNDELYAFNGTIGGKRDVYGNPTEIIISNPHINFNATLNIETDGVLIKNDDLGKGVLPIFNRYNTLLTENEITMFINSYNTRIQTLISSGDDSTKESADIYLKKIIDGELGIIGENRLFDGVKVQTAQTANSSNTTQLIELNQYLKASLYNEIGLNANFNMKRERLNTSEVELNTDSLKPFVDNMLMNRSQGIEKLNELYELQATVDLTSTWSDRNPDKEELVIETLDEIINEPIDEPIDELLEDITDEPIDEPINEPIDDSIIETLPDEEKENEADEY